MALVTFIYFLNIINSSDLALINEKNKLNNHNITTILCCTLLDHKHFFFFTFSKAEKLRKSERSEVLQIDEVFVKRNLKKKEEE